MGGTVRSSKHEPVFTMARELPWKVARATRLPTGGCCLSEAGSIGERYRRRLRREEWREKDRRRRERERSTYGVRERMSEWRGLLYTRDTRERSPTHSRELRRNKYGVDGSRESLLAVTTQIDGHAKTPPTVFREHQTSSIRVYSRMPESLY